MQCPPGGRKYEDKAFFFFSIFFFLFFSSPFFSLEGRRNISWLFSIKYSAGKEEETILGIGFSRYRSLYSLKWILTSGNLAPSQRVGSGNTLRDGKRHFHLFSVLPSLSGT